MADAAASDAAWFSSTSLETGVPELESSAGADGASARAEYGSIETRRPPGVVRIPPWPLVVVLTMRSLAGAYRPSSASGTALQEMPYRCKSAARDSAVFKVRLQISSSPLLKRSPTLNAMA